MPRLAVRGILLIEDRLLLVNAYSGQRSDLLCAPGGGVEPHASLPDNLARVPRGNRPVVEVGAPCMVNEFHAPDARLSPGRHLLPRDAVPAIPMRHGPTPKAW
jgi:8-oxo-dGTP diphosphatase